MPLYTLMARDYLAKEKAGKTKQRSHEHNAVAIRDTQFFSFHPASYVNGQFKRIRGECTARVRTLRTNIKNKVQLRKHQHGYIDDEYRAREQLLGEHDADANDSSPADSTASDGTSNSERIEDLLGQVFWDLQLNESNELPRRMILRRGRPAGASQQELSSVPELAHLQA